MIGTLNSQHTYPADLSNFVKNRQLPRHRWLEFKEGYSAELVKLACDESTKRKVRLVDPFMGSGTAMVSAGFLGHSGAGIEVNPFLHFAASAKCTRPLIRKTQGLAALDTIVKAPPREAVSPLEGTSTFTESPRLEKWIFNRSVLRGFTAIWQGLERTGHLASPLRLALLSSLMDCSNVRRDGKCVRYLKGWKTRGLNSADLHAVFRRRASEVINDLRRPDFSCQELALRQGDCREVLKEFDCKSFDLFVTSPPYLNSFDYSDVYRPELFAGEFVSDNAELKQIRLKTIRSHVQVKRSYSESVESMLLRPVLDSLPDKLWSRDIAGMIRSYFADMAIVLAELYRVVKSGGRGWLVVSTSAYGGIEVPVDLILADVAVKKGWKLVGVYVLRQLRAAGQHWEHLEKGAKPPLRESLIVIKKP